MCSDVFPRIYACCLAGSFIFLITNVKMDSFRLTSGVKLGYYMTMFTDFISFILRISLIVVLWTFVWRLLEPRTQLMRILRAAVLILGLLGILVVLRMTGRWLRSFNHTSFYFGVLCSVLVPMVSVGIRCSISFPIVVVRPLSRDCFLRKRAEEKSLRKERRATLFMQAKKPQPLFDVNIVTWVKIRFVSRQ